MSMRPKFRVVLEQAISEGLKRGYNRAHKHVEQPTEHALLGYMEDCLMESFYEYFDFEDDSE